MHSFTNYFQSSRSFINVHSFMVYTIKCNQTQCKYFTRSQKIRAKGPWRPSGPFPRPFYPIRMSAAWELCSQRVGILPLTLIGRQTCLDCLGLSWFQHWKSPIPGKSFCLRHTGRVGILVSGQAPEIWFPDFGFSTLWIYFFFICNIRRHE